MDRCNHVKGQNARSEESGPGEIIIDLWRGAANVCWRTMCCGRSSSAEVEHQNIGDARVPPYHVIHYIMKSA
jgi:hypothetical protein